MVIGIQIGPATTLLESTATLIGFGAVVGSFIAAAAGMLVGRSRKELEESALRQGFLGGLLGMFCLCFDLILRYAH